MAGAVSAIPIFQRRAPRGPVRIRIRGRDPIRAPVPGQARTPVLGRVLGRVLDLTLGLTLDPVPDRGRARRFHRPRHHFLLPDGAGAGGGMTIPIGTSQRVR